MKDKNLMIGIIACFAISVLFILVIVWEIKKSIDYDKKVRRLAIKATTSIEEDNRDFSVYQSIVGDDTREIFNTDTGELLFWSSENLIPLETTVKDYILFGDLHAKPPGF